MICGSGCEERLMVQLSLNASDMTPIAFEDPESFMPYGTMSICDPSSDRFEDEAVPPGRPSVHILCLCYEARQLYGSKCPNKENSLVTSISYYKYFAEGLSVETFGPLLGFQPGLR